jgi:hypothetical protein
MKLDTAIQLYAAAGTASEGSSVVSPNYANDMRVKDTARRRLVKTNPDIDSKGGKSTWKRRNKKYSRKYPLKD